jgi:hypothetical protein
MLTLNPCVVLYIILIFLIILSSYFSAFMFILLLYHRETYGPFLQALPYKYVDSSLRQIKRCQKIVKWHRWRLKIQQNINKIGPRPENWIIRNPSPLVPGQCRGSISSSVHKINRTVEWRSCVSWTGKPVGCLMRMHRAVNQQIVLRLVAFYDH